MLFDAGKGLLGFGEGIAATHEAEDVVVERLHAHGDAIDADALELLQLLVRDVERIQLDGEFRIFGTEGLEDCAERREVAESRRAAAEVNRLEGRRAFGCDNPLRQLLRIGVAVGLGDAGAGVKNAIRALPPTEGEVHVEVVWRFVSQA